mgnify:CR=1 FL=1
MNKTIAREIFNDFLRRYQCIAFESFDVALRRYLRENQLFYLLSRDVVYDWLNAFVRENNLECVTVSYNRRSRLHGGGASWMYAYYLPSLSAEEVRHIFRNPCEPRMARIQALTQDIDRSPFQTTA